MELVAIELNLGFIDGLCAKRVEADVSVREELSELPGKSKLVV